MLEAVHADLVFTISLKRSTQNLQLSTSWPADYPISSSDRYRIAALRQVTFRAQAVWMGHRGLSRRKKVRQTRSIELA
jgi:hypothetical protein